MKEMTVENAQINLPIVSEEIIIKKTLTERIQVKTSANLHRLFKLSKNLYNLANKLVYQGFHMSIFTTTKYTQKAGKWIRYLALYEELKRTPEYRALPAPTSQQILLLVDRNWMSFFKAMADWKLHPEKYKRKPNPPSQKEEDEEWQLIFTNQQMRYRNGLFHFPKRTELAPIKFSLLVKASIKQVRILPRGFYSVIEIVYERKFILPKRALGSKDRMIAIDLGVRNIVCIVNNCGLRPIIVKGGAIKSVNQFYNKCRAKYQQLYSERGIQGQAKRLERLDRKRNNKIEDLFHKLSRAIVSYCVNNDIGTIVIGYNEQWKQRSSLGRRNNQNFVTIPFYRLIAKIRYKAELKGIGVVLVEENHTSKCSFLDNEPIEHHEVYRGKRGVYRPKVRGGNGKIEVGLFKTAQGIIINSDVNGAFNILRKAFPKAITADGIEGLGLVPSSVTFAELERFANLKSTQKGVPKASNADGIEVWGFADEMKARDRNEKLTTSPSSKN